MTVPTATPFASSILLLACYELGHQPLSLAWPLAYLADAGVDAVAQDLSLQALDPALVAQAGFVGIAVPMHTALRLGVQTARRVRRINPDAHICFYGLYAWMNREYLLGSNQGSSASVADSVLAGETEQTLTALAQALLRGENAATVPGVTTAARQADPILNRLVFPLPRRAALPDLGKYARYMDNGTAYPAGYVEASRGCLHTCRHCPVVPIYNGRFFIVPVETVLADIRQQVMAGAQHITFGDPDFLNGPGHARKLAQALHAEFPDVSFDFTTKVEHILAHGELLAELATLGASFVVSAFESPSDHVLGRLEKGHTAADMDAALVILDRAGLTVQPTLVAFTPWTTLDDYLTLLTWMRTRRLIAHVPAVQLSVRLLVPPGSALLDQPDTATWIGALDAANFTYTWHHPDPRMDDLHGQVSAIAEAAGDDDVYTTFRRIEQVAFGLAGHTPPLWQPPSPLPKPPPRLTEDWFC
ncbi:MAG: radical SAM protein [Caldilineaceae bacterium]|nr:radical SAM protein [Caldilineaceae bacterium]MBP8107644.1 radical SAM protein [Caldilineaceae bacterium]MBP8123247.1 radical SAM protein [Caldilineaceae bacterium]MBP9072754.1 radical SAM protein [Caldilineaceae bacterium]